MNALLGTRRLAIPRFLVSVGLIVAAFAWTAAGVAAAASVTLGVGTSATLGTYLTGSNGLTLYTLSSDSTSALACTGKCLTFWPPLTVDAGGTVTAPAGVSGTVSTFVWSDNAMTQGSLNGFPLYYFANDKAAGQTNGEGIKAFGGVWHVAKAASAAPTATAPPTSTIGAAPVAPAGVPVAPLVAIAAGLIALAALARYPRLLRPR
ncbi:MAG: COG4315 family predicted lipoprotein [Candidatus Limnocylindrales bacterium]